MMEQLLFILVANLPFLAIAAYIEKTKCVEMENILNALLEKLGKTKAHLIPLNREALVKGAESVR